MKILLLIAPLIMCGYLIFVYLKYGMTKSISATHPKLAEKEKWMFGTMWVAYATCILMVFSSRWFIGASMMLALVAANPNYWDKPGLQDDLHFIGSYSVVTLGYVGLIMQHVFYGSLITALFIIFALGVELNFRFFKKVKNDTYWQEVFAALTIPLTLYVIL